MNKQSGVFMWGLTGFLLLFLAAFYIVKGGLINVGLALVMVSPFVFIIFIHLRPVWHVLIPIFLTMNQLTFPLYGLSKLTPMVLLLGAATFTILLDGTMRHSRRIVNFTLADRLISLTSMIVTLRLLYDRPGFVALGMGQGGFIRALTLTSATWFYFTVRIFVAQAKFSRKQLVNVARAVMVVCVITLYKGSKTGVYIGRYFGGEQFWMLCALMISLLATSTNAQKRQLLFYLTSLCFLLVAALSQFRSRIFFFAAEVFSVAFYMGRFRRTVAIVGICGAVGVVGIIAATGRLPSSMARVASLVVQVEKVELKEGSGTTGSYGWEDTGRAELYEAAWKEIKQSPLVGNGLGLDVMEAVGVLATTRRAEVELLILSGSYHNSIVMIAVKCGVPAAIMVSWALLYIIRRYMRWLRNVDNLEIKTWGMALVAFWFANTFMMLMNGGPNEFFAELILSGFMMGMMNNPSISDPATMVPLPSPAGQGESGSEAGAVA